MQIPPLRSLLSIPSVADVALKIFTVIASAIVLLKFTQMALSVGYKYMATFSVALVTSILVSLYIHIVDDYGSRAIVDYVYNEYSRILSFVSWAYW